jgi:protein O-GlcNAc transferase
MKSLNLLQQAIHLIEQEDYETVIALLERCIEDDPEELTYYWYLGLVYLLQENEELAQEIWLSILLQGNSQEVEQWTSELINFLEIKAKENITEKKLGNARIIYQSIFYINPDYENIELLNNLVEALSMFASTLSFNKEYEAARDVYLEALSLNPDHSISWHSLAFNYYYLEQYSKAKEAIKKAIKLDDSSAQNYYILGLILEKTDNILFALEAYQKAVERDNKIIETYDKLGDIYFQQKQIDKAIVAYQKALDLAFGSLKAPLFKKMANICEFLGDKSFVAFNLGYSAYFNNQNKESISYFEEFLESHPTAIDIYLNLCSCYLKTNQTRSAINLVNKAFELFPDNLENLVFTRLDQSILPILYEDIEEIKFYRERFSQRLDELIEKINLHSFTNKKSFLKIIETGTNYYLGFQGENDLQIQQKYSNYIYITLSKIYPQWCQTINLSQDIKQRKIRIGYISTRLYSFGRLYLACLKYSDKSKFETFVYDISGDDESVKNEKIIFRENFKTYSDYMRFIPRNIDDICPLIIADNLDILILPEIGLDTIMGHLSCLRLAPIQCTTWAHPMTSGSPNIDYFLSSDLMEPANAEEHYSEKLVRLPNLGFSIQPPNLRDFDKKRSDFQLRENSVVYLCCQSLLKYLPQHDYIFPSITQQNKLAQFVFFDSFLGSVITDDFKKRIDKIFTQFNLNYEDYCTFLKTLVFDDYLIVHQLSDIFLDSFGWSGGVTTLDTIACGLPIVTCPRKMMRSRQSDGMLRMIGVTETIAKTETEYIEIAVRLGLDQEWRKVVRDKMRANKHLLFDDRECIQGLESFFEEAIQKHSKM